MTIVGPILDIGAIFDDVEGTLYEESDDVQDHFYCAFLPLLRSPATLPPWLLDHRDIKPAVAHTQHTSSPMISHHFSACFPMVEKKEGMEKQI
jgi:hypothetical protein